MCEKALSMILVSLVTFLTTDTKILEKQLNGGKILSFASQFKKMYPPWWEKHDNKSS